MAEVTPQKHTFQAEVRQVLDIVIHSLYTHRDIFVRELISNAADALEKARYEKLNNESIADPDLPLEIRIDVSESAKTVTIADTGIGMSEADLVENLGTIAHSGTREFLRQLKDAPSKDMNLIGKFGVGFYSAFMAAKEVRVLSRSHRPGDRGVEWISDGGGEYTIAPREGLKRGTTVVLSLRDDAAGFASKDEIERIVKRYSNFVPFPIYIGDKKVNTVQALWTRNKNEITEDEYKEFYKFVANAWDEPRYRLHFSADAPLQVNALLFVPDDNFERMGLGKLEPGVSLYSRRVMIQQHSGVILPDWLRFVKGVADSEDLPLNISRETLQDNAVVRKLGRVITSRFIKFLGEEAARDPAKYKEFWERFGNFVKEGAASDHENRNEIAKLLRFESSAAGPGELVPLTDYAARMKAGQDKIYYLNGPGRESIEASPYFEAFRQKGIEVLYTREPIDDFVLSMLAEFEGKKIVSGDQADLDLPDIPGDAEEKTGEPADKLTRDEVDTLAGWFKSILGDRVEAVRESKRLVGSPAVIVTSDGGMSAQMQKVVQSMSGGAAPMAKLGLEINPGHPIIKRLAARRAANPDDEFAKLAAEQVYDAAMMAAGLVNDATALVNRSHKILERALGE